MYSAAIKEKVEQLDGLLHGWDQSVPVESAENAYCWADDMIQQNSWHHALFDQMFPN